MRCFFYLLLLFISRVNCYSHQEPTSFADLSIEPHVITLAITASTVDLAHELTTTEPAMLLEQRVIDENKSTLANTLLSRIKLQADGKSLGGAFLKVSLIPEKEDIRFEFSFPVAALPKQLGMDCHLFPYDVRHRTYLNIYQSGKLLQQHTFAESVQSISITTSEPQPLISVIGEFIYEGIHHIFIGPDHILFVVGLLLLGGSFGQLLKILTTFTIAHSITLCLATFHLVSPPAAVIEPIIALSIVVVGIHAFFGKQVKRDPRLLFAFGFGLIHGFGFASVLQEMVLPSHALAYSLFAFNFGVEIGQACILIIVVPLLVTLAKYAPIVAQRVTHGLALGVTMAGAFWFFQRIL